ncbi:MAG: hypothetical protein ABI623_11415 [bacterium]
MMKPIEESSCCTPQGSATHTARAMRDSGCGCAPVVEDAENLKLVVVTVRDVCCSVAAGELKRRVRYLNRKYRTKP